MEASAKNMDGLNFSNVQPFSYATLFRALGYSKICLMVQLVKNTILGYILDSGSKDYK